MEQISVCWLSSYQLSTLWNRPKNTVNGKQIIFYMDFKWIQDQYQIWFLEMQGMLQYVLLISNWH